MKRILMICMLLMGLVLNSCHQDEDELFTYTDVTLDTEDDISIERVQGTVSLTNLNTKQVTSSAEFNDNVSRIQILRGVYSVLVEGSIQYKDVNGKTKVRQFRASTDYVALEKEDTNVTTLQIIWM